jgi:hypothetical protein
MSTLLLLIPCIAITGPFTRGRELRDAELGADEHAFIWSDFKDAVKDNWKQGWPFRPSPPSCHCGVRLLELLRQMAQSSTFMIVPQVLTLMIGVIWALAVTYFYPLMVTYKLKMRDLFRNGFLLAVARLPQSAGIRLLHCVPTLIAAVVAFFFQPRLGGAGAFPVLPGHGVQPEPLYHGQLHQRRVRPVHQLQKIEGVEVNRGLNTEDEDDDEGDSDSQDEQ